MIIDKIAIDAQDYKAFETAVEEVNKSQGTVVVYFDRNVNLNADRQYKIFVHYTMPAILFKLGTCFGMNVIIENGEREEREESKRNKTLVK